MLKQFQQISSLTQTIEALKRTVLDLQGESVVETDSLTWEEKKRMAKLPWDWSEAPNESNQ
jgi:hypothetical protein